MHTSFHVMNFTSDCQLIHLPQSREVTAQIPSVSKSYSPSLLVVFCTVNIMAAILSLSGNALVFLTVVSFSELHITSNIGLASFALANVFVGILRNSLSAAVNVVVLQGGCPFSGFSYIFCIFWAHASIYSSLLNLALVTIERYVGVMHPLRYYVILPPERIAKFVAAVWFASLLLSVPNLVNNSAELSQNIMTFTFSLSLAITLYCNLKIHRVSRRQRQRHNYETSCSDSPNRRRKSAQISWRKNTVPYSCHSCYLFRSSFSTQIFSESFLRSHKSDDFGFGKAVGCTTFRTVHLCKSVSLLFQKSRTS